MTAVPGPVGTESGRVSLATRLADPGDDVMEHLIEGDFGDPRDMALWQREHLAAVIEAFQPAAALSAPAPESGLRAAVEAVLADGRSTFSIGGDLDLVVSVSDVRAALAAALPVPAGEGDGS